MRQRRARTLFLSVAAYLGLMAFTAFAAQAENLSDGGKEGLFLVLLLAALATLGVTFSITQVGTETILAPGRVDILCTTGTGTGEFHNDKDALATLTLSGCTAWQPVGLGQKHVTKVGCTVKEPIVMKVLILPKKHEGEPYILLEPQGGEATFTTYFLEGPECPLTKENKITGSFVFLMHSEDAVEQLLLASEEIQKLFQTSATLGDHAKFGAFELYLDAHWTVKLTGSHTGLPFGVC